jgi:hypothetical protein
VLGEDGDAFFALEVAGVHDPVDDGGALPERAGGAEHGVDEGGLTVVDVGDDGDIAQPTVRAVRRVGPLRGRRDGGCCCAHSSR